MQVVKWSGGDIHFDNNGKSSFVGNQYKLAQDLAFYILEALQQTMPKTNEDASVAIMGAVNKLKQNQSLKELPDNEKLKDVIEFFCVPDSSNPTTSFFYLSVESEAQELINKLFDTTNKTDLTHLLT